MSLLFSKTANARKNHTDSKTPAKKAPLQAKAYQYTKTEGHQAKAKKLILSTHKNTPPWESLCISRGGYEEELIIDN